jgi:hypothetical protein
MHENPLEIIPADFDAPDPDIIDMFENSAPLFGLQVHSFSK